MYLPSSEMPDCHLMEYGSFTKLCIELWYTVSIQPLDWPQSFFFFFFNGPPDCSNSAWIVCVCVWMYAYHSLFETLTGECPLNGVCERLTVVVAVFRVPCTKYSVVVERKNKTKKWRIFKPSVCLHITRREQRCPKECLLHQFLFCFLHDVIIKASINALVSQFRVLIPPRTYVDPKY